VADPTTPAPQYIFGTHTLAILQQHCIQSERVFNQSAILNTVPPFSGGGSTPAPSYLWGTHTLAILQDHAAHSSRFFQSGTLPLFPGIGMARVFVICEAEQPWPSPSWAMVNSSLIASQVIAQPTIIAMVTNTQFYPITPNQSDIFQPIPIPFVPPIVNYLVQATAIGWSIDPFTGQMVLRNTGDVFYVKVANFSDSSIDYMAGVPGGPFYGWMKIVPPGTPITNVTHGGMPFYDYQNTPRRTVF